MTRTTKKPQELQMLTRKTLRLLKTRIDSYHYRYYIGTLRYILENLEKEENNKKTRRK